jgi:hypothetical protein
MLENVVFLTGNDFNNNLSGQRYIKIERRLVVSLAFCHACPNLQPSFGLVLAKSGSINSGTEERELSSVDFGHRAVLGYGLAITLRYYPCPW